MQTDELSTCRRSRRLLKVLREVLGTLQEPNTNMSRLAFSWNMIKSREVLRMLHEPNSRSRFASSWNMTVPKNIRTGVFKQIIDRSVMIAICHMSSISLQLRCHPRLIFETTSINIALSSGTDQTPRGGIHSGNGVCHQYGVALQCIHFLNWGRQVVWLGKLTSKLLDHSQYEHHCSLALLRACFDYLDNLVIFHLRFVYLKLLKSDNQKAPHAVPKVFVVPCNCAYVLVLLWFYDNCLRWVHFMEIFQTHFPFHSNLDINKIQRFLNSKNHSLKNSYDHCNALLDF